MESLNTYLGKFLAVVIGFSKAHGATFVGGCAALAISRVCQVLAFFLPLKIFIAIHFGEVPDYFNVFPESMGFRETILLSSVLVPVNFGLYIGLGVVYRWLIDRHLEQFASTALLVDGKTAPEKKIKPLHNHVSKAFSDTGLVGVSMCVALFLDIGIVVTWVILLYMNLWLFHTKAFPAADHHRLTFLKLHPRQYIEFISSANFLVVFVVLAVELFYFDMDVYTAIFLLLVSRMVFQALSRFSIESLYIVKSLP